MSLMMMMKKKKKMMMKMNKKKKKNKNDDDDGGDDDDGDGEDNDNDSDTGDDDGDDDAYDRTRPMGYRTELGIGACRFPPMSAAHVRRVGWRGFRSPLPPPPRQRDCAPPGPRRGQRGVGSSVP